MQKHDVFKQRGFAIHCRPTALTYVFLLVFTSMDRQISMRQAKGDLNLCTSGRGIAGSVALDWVLHEAAYLYC